MHELAEARINFALHSPDFWRGLVIAAAILTFLFVFRVLLRAFRSPGPIPTSPTKVGQVSGLMSYLLLVFIVAGHQVTRLGEVTWSWRLVLSFMALGFGLVWALEMTNIPARVRQWRDDRKK